ncbi:MAG: ImmA/IrrE family metallo-endopeptidase [Patescibacteria group bacterium]
MANYIPRARQWEIDNLLDEIRLITNKNYPDDGLVEIIESFIPDVSIVEHDFDGDRKTRGAIFKKSKDFKNNIIAIQKKLDKQGKTFTLAHEFGHYCLGHTGSANFMIDSPKYDDSKRMQKEAEAQYFAASLLMPTAKFSHLSKYLDNKQLARRFGVSESAVQVRRIWLDGGERNRAI